MTQVIQALYNYFEDKKGCTIRSSEDESRTVKILKIVDMDECEAVTVRIDAISELLEGYLNHE